MQRTAYDSWSVVPRLENAEANGEPLPDRVALVMAGFKEWIYKTCVSTGISSKDNIYSNATEIQY